ncbi:MAG: SAM-dependent methyltransferase [Firmicutes bacterium]|nr:SAM-dependent methyltransferase [Bacillota bacterium]
MKIGSKRVDISSMPIKLKPRLAGVASLVPAKSVVADIGTDHAYLPLYLVKKKACSRVIAVEKSSLNSKTARETVHFFNLEQKVEVRTGDGLQALNKNDGVEVVVIAGLGGKTICSLLQAAVHQLGQYRRFVLQPMGDAALVRRWLAAQGYYFPQERLALENGYFYEIIAAEKGWLDVKEPFVWELGPTLYKGHDPLFIPWLEYKIQRYEKILQGLLRSRRGKKDPRWRYYHMQYATLKGVLRDVCHGD